MSIERFRRWAAAVILFGAGYGLGRRRQTTPSSPLRAIETGSRSVRWLLLLSGLLVGAIGLTGIEIWSARRQSRDVAVALTGGHPDRGPPLMRRYGCNGCHSLGGSPGASGLVGPPLDHLRDRVFIAGQLRNTSDNLIRWIAKPQTISPGTAMPNTGISADEARDVAAYLYSR